MDVHPDLFSGKTALVTGAGANIGRAIATEFSRMGASIAAVDIDEMALESLRNEIEGRGGEIRTLVADMGSQDSIDEMLAEVDLLQIEVDILVNNVGVHSDIEDARQGSFSNWRKTLDTNLVGPYYLTRRIVDRIVSRNATGNVVFISSIHQWQIRRHPAYSASKAAVGMVVKELADEYATLGIRVNGVAPGAVQPDDLVATEAYSRIPLHGTAIPASYIGRSTAFLASEFFSRYTTGTVLTVDAGLLTRGIYAS